MVDIDAYVDDNVIPIYKKTMYNEERFQIYMGGGGSGKSHFISQLLTIRMVAIDEAMKILVIRNVKEDNRNSTFTEIKNRIAEMNLEPFFKVNKSTMDITCTKNGNTMVFRGLDDIERVKSIASITQIWVNISAHIKPC